MLDCLNNWIPIWTTRITGFAVRGEGWTGLPKPPKITVGIVSFSPLVADNDTSLDRLGSHDCCVDTGPSHIDHRIQDMIS